MKVLVTGASGFVGRYLIKELAANAHTVIATDLETPITPIQDAAFVSSDIRDIDSLSSIIRRDKPDACVHMAALTFVPAGTKSPELMLNVNITGTYNLLEAFRKEAPAARILTTSSSHIYGTNADKIITEDSPLAPFTIYAISKAAADIATLAYARHFDMHTMTARANNHVGPGQAKHFILSSIAAQIMEIRNNKTDPVIKAGNVESTRDFADVRDVVKAYRLILEKGSKGNAYNITSGTSYPIRQIIEMMSRIAGIETRITMDPALFRPTDHSPRLDISRIKAHCGWTPAIPLEQTLKDMLQ